MRERLPPEAVMNAIDDTVFILLPSSPARDNSIPCSDRKGGGRGAGGEGGCRRRGTAPSPQPSPPPGLFSGASKSTTGGGEGAGFCQILMNVSGRLGWFVLLALAVVGFAWPPFVRAQDAVPRKKSLVDRKKE